jgi:DNA-binding CsgD family transcriptional regulator
MTLQLRPIETRILAMRQQGISDEEIGRRVRKTPERVAKIAEWATLPARGSGETREDDGLSAMEKRVLALRAEGQSHAEIAERFRRSPRFIRQVEGLAHYRKYRELLG